MRHESRVRVLWAGGTVLARALVFFYGTPPGIDDQSDDSNGYTLRLVAVTHDATMHPIG